MSEVAQLGLGLLISLILLWVLLSRLSRIFGRVTVHEYQHALQFKHGKLVGSLSPGSYWIYRPRTSIEIFDARPRVMTIPGQEVLSADGVTVKVSLLLDVRISDPQQAFMQSASHEEALYAKAQAALRLAIGDHSIEDILASRGELASRLQAEVEPQAQDLGLELRSLTVKDIMFPGPLKEAFSQAARARQEGQAALERARGETAALRKLANAARMLEGNPGLYQLRLLQAAAADGKIVLNVSPAESRSADGTTESD